MLFIDTRTPIAFALLYSGTCSDFFFYVCVRCVEVIIIIAWNSFLFSFIIFFFAFFVYGREQVHGAAGCVSDKVNTYCIEIVDVRKKSVRDLYKVNLMWASFSILT